MIVEKTATRSISDYTTLTMDGGTNNNSWVWMEKGVDTVRPDVGLPTAGSVFAAVQDAAHSFQMPASYATNCAVVVTTNGIPDATLTVVSPVAATAISILNAGGGASTIEYTITHQGGGTESGQLAVIDWHNLTPLNYAWVCNGRFNTDNGQTGESYTGKPRMFYSDIFLSDTVNPVVSITFHTTSTSRAVIFGLSTSADGVNYTPAPISGFNRDVVVEVGVPVTGSLYGKCNVIMDSGATNITGNTWYEVGFNTGAPTTGLPVHGTDVSGGSPLHTFTMPPSYTANDVLYLANHTGYTSGTLTLANPTAYTNLSFLGSAGNGPVVANVTVHFADTSTESYSISIADWFNGAAAFYACNGRFNPQSLALNDVNSGNPRLRISDIALVNNTSPVTSIDFAYSSGGRAMIFAVAGQAVAGGTFSPALVTGFNADGVVEAGVVRLQNPFYTATTASMDGGTNNTANTWYEMGYYRNMPNTGLPLAGSTFDSLAQPDHHYQMPASYAANNCVFVDTAHTNANLTLASPATYSAISFLSATANGNVTNLAIMQYADGTAETNTFISRDWFGNTPVAYYANGRVNLDNRSLNSDPGRNATPYNPRLYEAQFALGNTGSPLTNVILQYLNPTNSNSRGYIFAVSATAGAVPAIISSVSVTPGAAVIYEGSNLVFNAIITGGTAPITYQWQRLSNSVYVNLVNGGRVSGATTTNMTIAGGVWTDSGDYRLVASNVTGPVNSGIATLGRMLSTLPDVTSPGDAISIISGTTGAGAEGVVGAIDNKIQKYLNFSTSGGAPFVGPVGFVVKPAMGNTIASLLRIYTANDAEARDPSSYTLEGSLDGVSFTPISSGALALPGGRNTTAADLLNPLTQSMQEVRFTNSVGYTYYRVTFPSVKDSVNANSMQIGEFELLGVLNPNPPPSFSLSPVDVSANEGTTATFTSLAVGAATLTYQWYDVTAGDPGVLLVGKTSPNLALSNVTPGQSGTSYRVVATNPYGSVTNPSPTLPGALLTVNSGGPTVVQDLPAELVFYAGRTAALAVGVAGTAPTYQWQSNGVNLVNGGRLSGATSNVLSISNLQLSDAATYTLLASNQFGGPVSSTPGVVYTTAAPDFHTNGLGWVFLNGGADIGFFSGENDYTITTAQNNEQRAAWFTTPMWFGGFTVSFEYQNVSGGGADGFAFVVQNSAQGTNAIGGGGGGLAYSGIANSFAVMFNIFGESGVKVATGGDTGGAYTPTAPINFTSDKLQVVISYGNPMLTLSLSNTVTAATFTTNVAVGDLSAAVGTNVAYMGVTAATGGLNAEQHIANFRYVPRPSATASVVGANVVLTWPGTIGAYGVAGSTTVTGTYISIPGFIGQTNGLNQKVIAAPTGNNFYRLVLPLP